jgi:predicted nucleotidyltransferase
MPIDVSPLHLAIIQNILQLFVPVHQVVAFGSRVKGTAGKASDLDLCIMSNQPISFTTMGNLRDEFSLSDLPYKVDVVDWSTLTPDFRALIQKGCVEIQKENE